MPSKYDTSPNAGLMLAHRLRRCPTLTRYWASVSCLLGGSFYKFNLYFHVHPPCHCAPYTRLFGVLSYTANPFDPPVSDQQTVECRHPGFHVDLIRLLSGALYSRHPPSACSPVQLPTSHHQLTTTMITFTRMKLQNTHSCTTTHSLYIRRRFVGATYMLVVETS